MAILYRTNKQSMAFERRLVREGVPYVLAAQRSFYERKEVRDALAYLRMLRSGCNDSLALERILNVPPRKIGATTVGVLHTTAKERDISLWQAVELFAQHDNATLASEKDMMDPTSVTGTPSLPSPPPPAQQLSPAPPLPSLGKQARTSVRRFYELIMRFRQLAAASPPEAPPTEEPDEDNDDTDKYVVQPWFRGRQQQRFVTAL